MEQIKLVIENSYTEIIMALSVAVIILFVLLFITMIALAVSSRSRKMPKNLANLSLDENVINNRKEIDFMKKIQSDILAQIDVLHGKSDLAFSKSNLYRYNAMAQQGGQLSFILILLNDQHDGLLLHNLHSDTFSYIYAKKIKAGKAEEVLSKEEQEQLNITMKQ